MSSQNKPPYYLFAAIPVIAVITAAFALTTAAAIENLYYLRATGQIFDLVGTVRAAVAEQKTFDFSAGEDIWDDMVRFGQIPSNIPRSNSWDGQVRAISAGTNAMRIESDLPVHDCRRMALDFLARQPAALGLIAVEAQSVGDKGWKTIYPPLSAAQEDLTVQACGPAKNARLALVFRIR